jgi:hypothetical protein
MVNRSAAVYATGRRTKAALPETGRCAGRAAPAAALKSSAESDAEKRPLAFVHHVRSELPTGRCCVSSIDI